MSAKHSLGKTKTRTPKPLSSLEPSEGFLVHNAFFPEMNTVEAVLQNDGGEIFVLTDVSKEAKEVIDVEKFLMVYGLKSGHVKHMLGTTLVHEVDIDFGYSMPKK